MLKEVNEWGDIFYYKDEELDIFHREDGPACEYGEYAGGHKEWYLNGELHRIDGPAVEWADGTKYWCLNDRFMEFQEWKVKVRKYYDTEEDYLLMLLKLD